MNVSTKPLWLEAFGDLATAWPSPPWSQASRSHPYCRCPPLGECCLHQRCLWHSEEQVMGSARSLQNPLHQCPLPDGPQKGDLCWCCVKDPGISCSEFLFLIPDSKAITWWSFLRYCHILNFHLCILSSTKHHRAPPSITASPEYFNSA